MLHLANLAIDPANPPSWLLFLIMFVLVSLAVGFIVLLGGIGRVLKGLPFWPERERDLSASGRPVRVRRGSRVRAGSGSANPTLRHQDGTFAGSAGSGSGSQVRQETPIPALPGTEIVVGSSGVVPTIPDNLPASIDELTWAIAAVRLRLEKKEPTKEAAIIRVFPMVNSKGGGAWQRASKLYDSVYEAMSAPLPQTPEQPSASIRSAQVTEVV